MNTNIKRTTQAPFFSKGSVVVLLFLFLLVSTDAISAKAKLSTVTVEVNYGENKYLHKVEVPWVEGMTALEALEHAAKVSTHPVGNYVFVISINGVEAERGVMAWYYRINNQKTNELAIRKKIKSGDVITWLYTKDVCSATVDTKK